MKNNKGLIEGFVWFLGTIIFIKVMYKNTSWESIILGLLFIFSMAWFVFSLFQVYYGLKFYLSSQKWNYFTSIQWMSYLASVPLLMIAFMLYVNHIK